MLTLRAMSSLSCNLPKFPTTFPTDCSTSCDLYTALGDLTDSYSFDPSRLARSSRLPCKSKRMPGPLLLICFSALSHVLRSSSHARTFLEASHLRCKGSGFVFVSFLFRNWECTVMASWSRIKDMFSSTAMRTKMLKA